MTIGGTKTMCDTRVETSLTVDCPLQGMNVNRRRLIKLATLSLAGLALPAAWLSRGRADLLFSDMFGDARLAASLGRRHLAVDAGAARRGRRLAAELAAQGVDASRRRLSECKDADLRALDVVVVDGWVMARAEADLCAAVHLDRSLA